MLSSTDIQFLIAQEQMISPGDMPQWFTGNGKEWWEAWLERCKAIEGHTFDLTVSKVFAVTGDGPSPFLGRETRVTPKLREVSLAGDGRYRLSPAYYYLVQMAETLQLPYDIVGLIWPRTTPIRCGVDTWPDPPTACNLSEMAVRPLFGSISPGFTGQISVGLSVLTNLGFDLEPGARLISVRFDVVPGAKQQDAYTGVWRGDRVGTNGEAERPH